MHLWRPLDASCVPRLRNHRPAHGTPQLPVTRIRIALSFDSPVLEAPLMEDMIACAHLAYHIAGDECFEAYGTEIFLYRTSLRDIHAVAQRIDCKLKCLAAIYAAFCFLAPQSRLREVFCRG